ncbi:MAG: Gfo/Idh/MocA family oxidoreductase [Caldilineaceae bacterium]|nr:Gfo/Idh/MocA family oxidoreductase [Caldilineaceae bacterium]
MQEVRIGLIGTGFMGKAHATAYKNVPAVFGTELGVPVLTMLADIDEATIERNANSFGIARWTTDWHDLINDPEVDVVDITTPNHLHAEMAIAAAQAGKHVYCEKPLALSAPEAKTIVDAVEAAGVISMVGFNYLKNPIQGFAKEIIESGEIGEITLFRGQFDQDILVDPTIPFSWRMDKQLAGSGALGDLGAHTISLAQFLLGDTVEVCGTRETVIKERTLAASGSGYAAKADANAGKRGVENEDVIQFLVQFRNGAIGTLGTSRIGSGRKIGLGYEIQGTKGALVFTQERMNELQLYRNNEPSRERGFKTIFAGPDHPHYGAFFGAPGIGLGYNDQKIIEAYDLVKAIATNTPADPDVRFAYEVNKIIDAVLLSCEERRWVTV